MKMLYFKFEQNHAISEEFDFWREEDEEEEEKKLTPI